MAYQVCTNPKCLECKEVLRLRAELEALRTKYEALKVDVENYVLGN